MKGVRVIYLRFAWRRRKGKMRRLVKSWKFLSLHKNAEFIVPSYLFWAWNFHNKITTSKKCDLISLFLKRGKLCVFLFCTTNAETNKNRTGWPGDHGSNPQFPKQNTAPRRPRNPRELSLFFFFLASLYGDKCTSQSLKNWIQVTAQSLLRSETQGRPGTFSEPRRCLQGQDSVSPHVVTSMVIQARSLGLP